MPHKGYKQTKSHIEKLTKVRTGIKRSKETRIKYSIAKTDNKHPGWKGDDVKMVALHQWIERKLGKPKVCEHCGFKSNNRRRVQWANKSGKYKRILSDWLRLCVSCHMKYDNTGNKIWITRRLNIKNYEERKEN